MNDVIMVQVLKLQPIADS